MYTSTLTAEIARQHIEDLHRQAETGRLARRATARPSRARKARKDLSWMTVQRWHVATAN